MAPFSKWGSEKGKAKPYCTIKLKLYLTPPRMLPPYVVSNNTLFTGIAIQSYADSVKQAFEMQ